MIRKSLSLAVAMMAASAAHAEVSYNYFELGYLESELDVDTNFGGFDVDGDGFAGGLSFSLTEDFFFLGDIGQADLDFGIDLTRIQAGFGWHSAVSEPAQAVVQVTWQRLEADVNGGDASDNGFGVSVGGRGEFNESVEWDAFIDYVDIDDSDVGFSGELRYKFTPQLAIGANFATIDDFQQIGIHFRWLYAN